jgi:hypothetical protein
MFRCYCADPALEMAIVDALQFYGLEANPADASRRPSPARTVGEQFHRIDLGRKVLALVRRQVAVGPDGRLLIGRLVDSACQRLEEAEQPARVAMYPDASEAAVVAYAAAGGGAIGTFESFRRTFLSDADLLEVAGSPVVDRQDVQPPPLTTNPTRGPARRNPPGSSSPVKTNPTRTIRSSRWVAGGKAVQG